MGGGTRTFDSVFEAQVAAELIDWLEAKPKRIIRLEFQYRVEIPIYTKTGEIVHKVNHKIDFRVQYPDKSFSLIEAKGFATPDWKWRKRLLDLVWLAEHPDHVYSVWNQNNFQRYKFSHLKEAE